MAREVYESGRTNIIFVSSYAFALHTQGKTGEGLKLMEAFSEEDLQRPEIALYYGILLGDRATARKPSVTSPQPKKGTRCRSKSCS